MQTQEASRNSEAAEEVSKTPPQREQGVELSLSGPSLAHEAAWLGFQDPPPRPAPPIPFFHWWVINRSRRQVNGMGIRANNWFN